ncbi:MAG TPA: TetR/AcrR family transcriptional regulator [Pyrinomonadaceae bacterium]|nr:TetR/AcrR family transcriptional regulator [Pyrinomonadaceae bacterium]
MRAVNKSIGEPLERAAAKARRAHGERTRQAILEVAVDIASAEGLEGLSIGRLAAALSMSKSGLFAHFGSKEELQLAAVEAARSVFIREVISPAFEAEKGLPRLWQLCEVWLEYVRRKVFRGGCFFAAAAAEFDGRPGVVRDRIAEIMREWLSMLKRSVAEAQEAGQLDKAADPAQLAFELNALEMGANWAFQLHGDRQAFARARAGMLERLRRDATDNGRALLTSLKRGTKSARRAPRGLSKT